MNPSGHNSITAQLALIQIQEIGKIGGKNNMTHEKSKRINKVHHSLIDVDFDFVKAVFNLVSK